MEIYHYILLIMIKECSKTKLPKKPSKKSNKSLINTQRSINSRQFFNNNYNSKEKTIQQNPSILQHYQNEANLERGQQMNIKLVKKLHNFQFWRAFFIGISIIQFLTQLGIFLLQYLGNTINIKMFLLLIIAIITLMALVIVLTVKLKLEWMEASKSTTKAIQQFNNEQFIRERSMFDTIHQSHCATPTEIAKLPENVKEQHQHQGVIGQCIHKDTLQRNIDKTNKIIYLLTIIKFIQSTVYITINTLSLTLFIPLQVTQRQTAITIGIFSYLFGFLSLIISAFVLKKSVDLITELSSNQEGVQCIKQQFNVPPPTIKSKPQDIILKKLKFTNINDEHFDDTLKSVKLVRLMSESALQGQEKQLKSQIALKKSSKSKKSVLKKQLNNRQQSKPQSAYTQRRKVQINSKKIQFFQYPAIKSKKRQQGSIKLRQLSNKDIRLQNLKKKIKGKAKSLERHHSSSRKTIRFITTHKSTTTLQTKASSWKSKRLQ